MQQQQRWTSTWPKGLNCTLQEPYYLLSLVLLTLMRISRDKMPKDSEENMYLISKGILAVWSSQIYMGYALLTKKRVKRWIIDLYRIINWLRIVMATKTARSFIFYLLSEMYPSGMSFLWTCYPELFFFSFSIFLPFGIISWHLLSSNPSHFQSGDKELVSEPMICTLKMPREEAAVPLNDVKARPWKLRICVCSA